MTNYLTPPEGAITQYAVSRRKLHITKAKQQRIKKLCNPIGMAHDAAKRQCEAEWNDGSLLWVQEAIDTLPEWS